MKQKFEFCPKCKSKSLSYDDKKCFECGYLVEPYAFNEIKSFISPNIKCPACTKKNHISNIQCDYCGFVFNLADEPGINDIPVTPAPINIPALRSHIIKLVCIYLIMIISALAGKFYSPIMYVTTFIAITILSVEFTVFLASRLLSNKHIFPEIDPAKVPRKLTLQIIWGTFLLIFAVASLYFMVSHFNCSTFIIAFILNAAMFLIYWHSIAWLNTFSLLNTLKHDSEWLYPLKPFEIYINSDSKVYNIFGIYISAFTSRLEHLVSIKPLNIERVSLEINLTRNQIHNKVNSYPDGAVIISASPSLSLLKSIKLFFQSVLIELKHQLPVIVSFDNYATSRKVYLELVKFKESADEVRSKLICPHCADDVERLEMAFKVTDTQTSSTIPNSAINSPEVEGFKADYLSLYPYETATVVNLITLPGFGLFFIYEQYRGTILFRAYLLWLLALSIFVLLDEPLLLAAGVFIDVYIRLVVAFLTYELKKINPF